MKVEPAGQTVFTMDLEKSIENAIEFSDLLLRHGLLGEFYICGSIVAEHPAECKKIARHHIVGGHGFSHESFSRLPVEKQRRLIQKTKMAFAENGLEMPGWRFPKLSFTAAGLQLLASQGIYDSSFRLAALRNWNGLYFVRNWLKLIAFDHIFTMPRPFPNSLLEKPFSAVDIEDKAFFKKQGRLVTHCYNFPEFSGMLEAFLAARKNNNYNNH